MTEHRRKRRSAAWFGGTGKNAFMHRSWMKNEGHPPDVFDGRPVIGICNTWSELTPCNAHLRGLAEHGKRGVYEAGGLRAVMRVLGEAGLLHAAAPTVAVIEPSRRHAGADAPHGPCRGVRDDRALSRAHRRPGPRHRCGQRHGAEELRPEGLSGHGRGRQHAAAGQAPEAGRHRHGAHLRRAHERDRVLPTAPEAAGGGPLARMQDGDLIELDVEGRLLHLHVSEADLAERRSRWRAPGHAERRSRWRAPGHAERRSRWRAPGHEEATGYRKLFIDHMLQADQGCDFDFLLGRRQAGIPRHSH